MNNKNAMLLMLHALTPTHAGSGTQISYVDLPIQRESHTGFPKIDASSLKGSIRYTVGVNHNADANGLREDINRIFGNWDNGDFASAVSFTDARLLFFPVKSAIGIFKWITCPYVIRRFMEDYSIAAGETQKDFSPSSYAFNEEDGKAYYPSLHRCTNSADNEPCKQKEDRLPNRIMLEDYTYDLKASEPFGKFLHQLKGHIPDWIAGGESFWDQAILVNNDDFSQFVQYSTEVSTRIKINRDTGTVDGTALFTEEFLPPESLLYSVVICNDSHLSQKESGTNTILSASQVKNKFKELFDNDIFQLGSDSTLGKGLIKKYLWEVNQNGNEPT